MNIKSIHNFNYYIIYRYKYLKINLRTKIIIVKNRE